MFSLALALSMLALEESVASAREQRTRVPDPEPAALDAAGRAARAAAWRRWAAEGREAVEATPTPHDGGTARQSLRTGAGG